MYIIVLLHTKAEKFKASRPLVGKYIRWYFTREGSRLTTTFPDATFFSKNSRTCIDRLHLHLPTNCLIHVGDCWGIGCKRQLSVVARGNQERAKIVMCYNVLSG